MTGYAIEWDGRTVALPPAGSLNPDGVSWAWIYDDDGNGVYDVRLAKFAAAAFAARGSSALSISVSVVLIPRPDNVFDRDAVSIALPKSTGGDAERRCLGYLYRHTIHNWGIANAGRKDLIARLAAFSQDGEVCITATMSRETDCTYPDLLETWNDDDNWYVEVPEFSLDLPNAETMGQAIASFLAAHEPVISA